MRKMRRFLVGSGALVVALASCGRSSGDEGQALVASDKKLPAEQPAASSSTSAITIQSDAGTRVLVPEDLGVEGFSLAGQGGQFVNGVEGWEAPPGAVDDLVMFEARGADPFTGSYASVKVSSEDPALIDMLNGEPEAAEVANLLRYPVDSVKVLPLEGRHLVQIAPAETLSGAELGQEDRTTSLWILPTRDGRSTVFVASDALTTDEVLGLVQRLSEKA